MTRGRDGNHAYVVVEDNQTAIDALSQAITRDWIDQPAVARREELDLHRSRQLPDPGDENEFAAPLGRVGERSAGGAAALVGDGVGVVVGSQHCGAVGVGR
jgi:hypothetical protein